MWARLLEIHINLANIYLVSTDFTKDECKVYVTFRTSGLKHCFGRLRQENNLRQALGNIGRPLSQKKKKNPEQNSPSPGMVETDPEFKEYQASLITHMSLSTETECF